MNFIDQIERLKRLNLLILSENTGSSQDLGKKLSISKRQAYNLLEMMKDMGVKIDYSKKSKTYFYASTQRLHISFSLQLLHSSEEKEVWGGLTKYKFDCNFFSLCGNSLDVIQTG